MVDDAPDWFRRALAEPFDEGSVTVDGARIRFLAWGPPDRPGLVLVHGGAAHAHWWTHVAPQFSDDYRVVALDLSGHGDSDRRDDYPMATWSDEIMAVAEAGAIAGRPIVIGHSMGGFVTLATAARYPDDLAGAVIIDSPVFREDPEVEQARLGTTFKAPRPYRDRDEMLRRFRTVPEQDHYLPYVIDHVARQSIAETDAGFLWKFDANIFRARRGQVVEFLPRIHCRVALFRAEHGLATAEVGDFMYEQLGRVAPVVLIPEAGHHVMLDQPLLLVTAIRTLLADWEHSIPHRRGDT
ncbi:MAG: alpha/beta hydrolase [Acidimicrobiia bacterium]|nr:alpha/beta hydrolase [Acidimicrobiia bacterium]